MHSLIKYIKLIFLSTFSFFVFCINYVNAEDYGLKNTADKAFKGDRPFSDKELPVAIGELVGNFLAFLGIIYFILILWAGISWMTSMGNAEQVNKARNMLMHAIIGFIIIMSAYGMASFIGNAISQ